MIRSNKSLLDIEICDIGDPWIHLMKVIYILEL